MSERRKCKHCQQLFCPRPQNPDQHYCSERECQRTRKRIWQKNKLLSDPDYRTNQSAAQSCWQKKNPDYWSNYRAKNPDYMEDNRQRQQERNRRRRVQEIDQMAIAKMDASIPERSIPPGRYLLTMVESGMIAKMDALIVEINVVSGG